MGPCLLRQILATHQCVNIGQQVQLWQGGPLQENVAMPH